MSLPWPIQLGAFLFFFFVVVPYGLGPVLIFMTLRLRVPAEVIPFDPRQEPLPEEVRPHFAEAHEQLAQDAFQLAGTMILPSVVANVKSILALYANRSAGDMAMTTFIVTTGEVVTLKTRYVEFVTRFSDDVVVQTNNSRELGSFPNMPDEYTFQFWDLTDSRRLYQLHRLLVERHRRAGRPVMQLDTEYGGDAVAYVAHAVLEKTFERQQQTGYLRRLEEAFGPTVQGAVLMTWKELWPWKALRRMRRKRVADQILAEFRSP